LNYLDFLNFLRGPYSFLEFLELSEGSL
jgi:hypothetical protein